MSLEQLASNLYQTFCDTAGGNLPPWEGLNKLKKDAWLKVAEMAITLLKA